MKSNVELIDEIVDSPLFNITKEGRIFVRFYPNGKVAKDPSYWREAGDVDNRGYARIRYKYKKFSVHRIIYRKFKGKLVEGMTVNHIDGNKLNNNINNLELVTQSDNNKHMYRVLKHKPVYGNKKINFEIADNIRQDKQRGLTYAELVEKYGVSKGIIGSVVRKETWVK